MMNKEQLRLKLIEAYAKGGIELRLRLSPDFIYDWGFNNVNIENLADLLDIKTEELMSNEFNAFSYSIALEITNWPLMQALK